MKHLPVPINKLLKLVRKTFFDEFAKNSYSQEGEDMILNRIFDGRLSGFYVDVGAHHPRRFSNTFFFYKRGWSGINIEPNPEAIKSFKCDRARDINLQCGVSECEGTFEYYCFNEPALNTFDKSIVQSRLENTFYRLVKTDEIPVLRLDSILKRHLPVGREIDFLSVDVEGFDIGD